MKANELMIGDWISVMEIPAQVFELSYDNEEKEMTIGILDPQGEVYSCYYGYDHVEPIPLTAEILEKNEFAKMSNSPCVVSYMWSTGGVAEFADVTLQVGQDHADKWRWDCLTLKIHLYKGDIKLHKIRYVHQLQHALRLCNIEKEIIL